MTKITMPFGFDVFKQACADKGYTTGVVDQNTYARPQMLYAMRTKNGIKAEIKPKSFSVGYGQSADELKIIQDELLLKGYQLVGTSNSIFSVKFKHGEDILEQFWTIVDLLENIDAITARRVGIGRKVFTREESDSAIFEKIAKRYKFAIENKDQDLLDLSRSLLSSDKIDHIITLGCSKNGDPDSYREHLVPCILIHNQAINMTLGGKSVIEIAQMIKSNLAIVHISDDEQVLLDVTLGLQVSMPAGWQFGDSIFARLNAANIEI